MKKKIVIKVKKMRKRRKEIYERVIGAVHDSNIQSIFEDDSIGDLLYEEIFQIKNRLNQRLGLDGKEDADIERIINYMFDICRIVGYKMYVQGYLTAK